MSIVAKDNDSPKRKIRQYPRHDWILAFGMVLFPSTEFRLGGLPFGPGELLLIFWAGIGFAIRANSLTIKPNSALTRIFCFWCILLFAESVGMLVGFNIELFQDWNGIRNDVIAYTMMIIIGLGIAIEFGDEPRRRHLVWLAAGMGTVSLTLQLLQAYGLPGPGVPMWNYDRLKGWSENPNQLGLLSSVVTMLLVHLADTAKSRSGFWMAMGLGVAPIAVGYLTRSDSYIVCMLAAGAVFVALKSLAGLRATKAGLSPQGTIVVMCVVFLPLMVVAAAPFGALLRDEILAESAGVYGQGDQGDVRVALWKEAVEKGMWSGMLGLGPGPHLTSKSFKRPPPGKFEAHNTPLDLFAQGGFLALLAYIWLGVSTFSAAWRARLPASAALITGMMAFSMFHFVMRQPLFWFAIVLCLLEAGDVRTVARRISVWPRSRREGRVQ